MEVHDTLRRFQAFLWVQFFSHDNGGAPTDSAHKTAIGEGIPAETWPAFIARAAFLHSGQFRKLLEAGDRPGPQCFNERMNVWREEEDEVTAGNGSFSDIFLSTDLSSHERLALQAVQWLFVAMGSRLLLRDPETRQVLYRAH